MTQPDISEILNLLIRSPTLSYPVPNKMCLNENSIKWAATWEKQQSAKAKTKAQISFAVTAKLISAFVFDTRIVQFLYFINPKFQASSLLLCLYRSGCVRPVRKTRWFSHEAAQIILALIITLYFPYKNFYYSAMSEENVHTIVRVRLN